ncbi:MAG: hypothetical protein K0A93_02655 [Desulfuromonadaceae bacterium]|nr:hypothetical protein [Desulfuromonadaceae bacterium]
MFTMRLGSSLLELALMIVMSGLIIEVIYRLFIKANPDFDMEEEICKGNAAVGTLMAAIMVSAALLLMNGLEASVTSFRLALNAPSAMATPLWQAGLLICGHLFISLAIAVLTISFTLRLFGKLTRKINPEMHLGKMLKNGNLAVGILLSAVVFISAIYVGAGVSSVTKALVPQPQVGRIQLMK